MGDIKSPLWTLGDMNKGMQYVINPYTCMDGLNNLVR